MSNVVPIRPPETYFTVRPRGRAWTVQIVTPIDGRAFRTVAKRFRSRIDAIAYAKRSAAGMGRPFRMGGAA